MIYKSKTLEVVQVPDGYYWRLVLCCQFVRLAFGLWWAGYRFNWSLIAACPAIMAAPRSDTFDGFGL